MPHQPPPAESRRRRFRPLLLLVLGLVLVDLVVLRFRDLWERYSPDDYAARVEGCATRPRDFVLAGGSPVAEGLDPDVVAGVRWKGTELHDGYAIGLPGATTSEVYHAVRHSCPTPPRLLVYGITASDLNDDRHEPHGPYSLMDWDDWAAWARTQPASREWVTRKFLEGRARRLWAAYRYRHGVRMWAAAFADELSPGCCPESAREAKELRSYADALRSGNGYAPAAGFADARYDRRKAAGAKFPPFAFLNNYRTGDHLAYLHKLADWCAANGTDLVLLDMPVTADLDAKYPAAVSEYQTVLAGFAADRGIPVIRANREGLGFTDADFADIIHLNGHGAKKLSAWLRVRLAERGGARP